MKSFLSSTYTLKYTNSKSSTKLIFNRFNHFTTNISFKSDNKHGLIYSIKSEIIIKKVLSFFNNFNILKKIKRFGKKYISKSKTKKSKLIIQYSFEKSKLNYSVRCQAIYIFRKLITRK